MSTTSITFRLDENLKKQAESLFENMGMNMTTALNVFVRAAVREGRMPFAIVSDEYALRERISAKLKEAEEYAARPDAVWRTQEEVFGGIREKFGYEV